MPKAKNTSSSSSDSGPDDLNPPASKKSKASSNKSKSSSNDKPESKKIEGNKTYWVLEKQRQIRINEFRGRKFVDIREFYEKNGEFLPGKKGISLTPEQWQKLLAVADEVNGALEEI